MVLELKTSIVADNQSKPVFTAIELVPYSIDHSLAAAVAVAVEVIDSKEILRHRSEVIHPSQLSFDIFITSAGLGMLVTHSPPNSYDLTDTIIIIDLSHKLVAECACLDELDLEGELELAASFDSQIYLSSCVFFVFCQPQSSGMIANQNLALK